MIKADIVIVGDASLVNTALPENMPGWTSETTADIIFDMIELYMTKRKTYFNQHVSSSGRLYQGRCEDFILQQIFIKKSKMFLNLRHSSG